MQMEMGFRELVIVFCGGGLGSALRFGVGHLVGPANGHSFPWATFAINLLGSFLMGIVFAALSKPGASSTLALFVAVGVLGGFTTFSTFSREAFELLRNQEWLNLALYAAASPILGIALCALGYQLVPAKAA